MVEKRRVAVLMGGRTAEHEVSLNSGRNILRYMDKEKNVPIPVVIEKNGRWRYPVADGNMVDGESVSIGDGLNRMLELKIDVVFIVIHGPDGEDGNVQGLLEMASLPYIGSGVEASGICLNKVRTKELMVLHHIRTPDHLIVDGERFDKDKMSLALQIQATMGLPVVLKTPRLGSSVGVTIPKSVDEMLRDMETILRYDSTLLVERFIAGRELTCGVMGPRKAEKARALPVLEIIPQSSEFFDYKAKYEKGASLEICPARIPDEVGRECQAMAVQVHTVMGCRGLSRVDFMWETGGDVYAIEINTIPGMTETSLYPQEAAAAGISFTELIEILLETAVGDYQENEKRRRFALQTKEGGQ